MIDLLLAIYLAPTMLWSYIPIPIKGGAAKVNARIHMKSRYLVFLNERLACSSQDLSLPLIIFSLTMLKATVV